MGRPLVCPGLRLRGGKRTPDWRRWLVFLHQLLPHSPLLPTRRHINLQRRPQREMHAAGSLHRKNKRRAPYQKDALQSLKQNAVFQPYRPVLFSSMKQTWCVGIKAYHKIIFLVRGENVHVALKWLFFFLLRYHGAWAKYWWSFSLLRPSGPGRTLLPLWGWEPSGVPAQCCEWAELSALLWITVLIQTLRNWRWNTGVDIMVE